MKRVFVDSWGFFAHLVAEDAWHERATALFQAARADSWRLMTTNAVLFETYALLLSRTAAGRRHAIAFLDHIERGLCQVERVSARDEKRAIALVRSSPRGQGVLTVRRAQFRGDGTITYQPGNCLRSPLSRVRPHHRFVKSRRSLLPTRSW